jgi:hypothetical protein
MDLFAARWSNWPGASKDGSQFRFVLQPLVASALAIRAGRETIVRIYELELLVGSDRVPGSLVLDTDNHAVEQQLGSQRTIRIE